MSKIVIQAHGSLLKTNLSLQEQQNGSIFKVKVLSDKETRLTGELERFTSLEHRYLQLLRVLQTVLQEFIQKRTKERAEAKKKEFSEPVLKRMKGLSREYLGLDLPALMEKEPALNEQLSTILTKTDFEAELLLFLKEQVLH